MLNSIVAAALLVWTAPALQDGDEGKVQKLLDSFVKAIAGRDRDGVVACFDTRKMVRELEARGVQFGIADEEKRMKVLQGALPRIGDSATGLGNGWEKIRLVRLKPHPEGREAEAFCRLTLAGGSRTKIRLWIVKNEDAWQIYDLEMQDENIRLSVTLGAVYAAMAGDDKSKRTMILAFTTLQKAMVKLGEGEAEEAHELLKKALEAEPPVLVRAWLELVNGQTLALLGRHEDAVASADRVLGMQKDLLVAHHLKAAAYFELEEYEKCIASEKEFMSGVGDDAEAWEKIGECYEHLEKRDEAIGAYRKGAVCDEEEHVCRLALGRLLLEAGKGAEATAPLVEAVRNAKDPEILEEAADLVDRKGEPAALLALAEEQAKATPDDSVVAKWKGRALRKMKRFEEAEKVLRSAIEKEEDDHRLAEELVFTLAHAGKEKAAMERLDAMAADQAERVPFLRAYVHAVADRTAKVLEELAKFLDVQEDGEYLLELIKEETVFAKVREDKGYASLVERTKTRSKYSQAVDELVEKEDWEAVLKLSRDRAAAAPDHAHAHFNQGHALRRLGRFLDAEIALKAAIEKKKDRSDYHQELGKALVSQGRLDEALAVADGLLKLENNKVPGLFLRVVVYAMAKKSDPALRALDDLMKKSESWWGLVEGDADLEEFRKLPVVQELIKKAKSEE